MTKTTTTYALPAEPDGPVWDRNGDKWERTGEMLYCDSARCRVNTFERGDERDDVRGRVGLCPGCRSEGEELR